MGHWQAGAGDTIFLRTAVAIWTLLAVNLQSLNMNRTLRNAPVLLALTFAACGGGDAGTEPANTLVIGGEDAGASATNLYQMPTPNELFGLVRNMAGDGHKRMLNPAVQRGQIREPRGHAPSISGCMPPIWSMPAASS